MLAPMIRAAAIRLVLIASGIAGVAGCASTPPLFPAATTIPGLAPDERVLIGQVLYTMGDIRAWLPQGYDVSSPEFSYDLWHRAAPTYDRSRPWPTFGPRGGVFVLRAKKATVYFDLIRIETSSFLRGDRASWPLRVGLKLPLTDARCAFVGTILVDIHGPAPKLPWFYVMSTRLPMNNTILSTVADTYDRDRAALETYVPGCELQKALAVTPSREEIEALLEQRRTEFAAQQAAQQAERRDAAAPAGEP